MKEHSGVPQDLIELLQMEQPAVRWQAAMQLRGAAQQQQSQSLSALTQALADDHPFVRWRAGLALAQANQPAALAALRLALSTGSPEGQAAAADALGGVHKVDPLPLLEALNSPHACVRQSAAEALAHQRSWHIGAGLVERLADESAWVRRAAATALGHIGDRQAVAPLIECLSDSSALVRRSAAYALGAMRARQAAPALSAALDDPDPAVRRNAAWALGRLAVRSALPGLESLLDDPALDGEVAEQAARAIRAIQRWGWQWLLYVVGSWLMRRPPVIHKVE